MQIFDAAHTNPQASDRSGSIVVVDSSPLSLITTSGVLYSRGYQCVCARTPAAALEALQMGRQDLFVWEVAEDPGLTLSFAKKIRDSSEYGQVPIVFLADGRWAGLEQKVERMESPTRCIFKPVDPNVLIAVVDHLLWMPSLIGSHRRRGSRPTRPNWVTL